MPDEISRQLEAFGETLAERTGEPIRAGSPATASAGHRPTRRWWALGGAAACLVAVVAALGLVVDREDAEPVAAPATSDTTTTTTTTIMTTTTTTTTTMTTTVPRRSLDARVGEDPLGLVRDGWILQDRTAGPFELAPDELPCPASLAELNGVEEVHDVLSTPEIDGLDVDAQFLAVGDLDGGTRLTDAILEIGECIESEQGVTVEVTSLSSVRATWFRAGPDFALAAVVGEDDLSIVLEVEGHVFTDLLVADLAHRAAQFLAGREVVGAPADTPVATTTLVPQAGPFVERGPSTGEPQVEPEVGEVKLWVSNQSFEDDPVAITIRLDGIPVVGETFFVESQHNWQSFMIRGLAPGDHTVTAESDTGASRTWTFTLPADQARWLVVDYWYYPDDAEGRHFTFLESDEPVAFS